MEYKEVIALLEHGFTRDEIITMMEEANTDNENPTPTDNENPTPTDNEVFTSVVEEVKDVLNSFKNELTAMNILNSQIGPERSETGEDILAKIVNPITEDNKK